MAKDGKLIVSGLRVYEFGQSHHYGDCSLPSLSSTDSFPGPAPYQVNEMCTALAGSLKQGEPASRTVQTDQGEALCPAITAVANPETVRGKDPYFKMASPSVNCLEVPGKSHLIRDSNEPRVLESFLKIR